MWRSKRCIADDPSGLCQPAAFSGVSGISLSKQDKHRGVQKTGIDVGRWNMEAWDWTDWENFLSALSHVLSWVLS